MDNQKTIDALRKILPEEQVIIDETVRREAVKDYIGYRRYERNDGKYNNPLPVCVVKPKSTQEVSKVLALLNELKVPVVARTGGSSVTKSIESPADGVVVDGSEMNQIYEINETDMTVTVGCGVPLEGLENHLNSLGYTTGHFPQSLPMAHIGGLIATRSTGQFSTMYGGIEHMVVGLEAVLADGTIIEIKDVPRRSAGPDIRHVFIGNEGAFGYITKASIGLHLYKPETRWMNSYAIKGMSNGLELIRQLMINGFKPAVVRLHDEDENGRVFNNIAPEGYCLLMFLAEGPAPIVKATADEIERLIALYDTKDLGKEFMEWWLIHRNDVNYELDSPKRYNMGITADTCEVSAMWSQIGNIYHAIVERLTEEMPNLVYIGAHSSHSYIQGTNMYFTFAYRVEEGMVTEQEYMKLIGMLMEETLKRGGSIAHHHGSGKYRTKWMPQEHGSSYEVMLRLKDAMDPNHIMNPGDIIIEK